MMTFKTILIVALHIIFSLDILPLLVVQTVLSVNIDIGEVEQAVEAGNLKLSVDNIVVSSLGVSHREFRQIKLMSPSTTNIVHCRAG